MWFKREQKNRRLHRIHVLDVKLRSDQVRSTRVRLVAMAGLLLAGTFLSLYLFWRVGAWTLDTFVYSNADFAIQQIDVQTDGVIAPEQLRRWSGVKPQANLIGLDLAAVKRNHELVSVIDSVSVERVLPRTLKIRVTERDPIAQVNVAWADAAGGITVHIFQLDADGVVMQPLDPRLCVVPLAQMNSQLPVIVGLNSFQLQPGRRMELPQVQAALRLVSAFEHSPMAGLVDLRRVDVSAPGVVVAPPEGRPCGRALGSGRPANLGTPPALSSPPEPASPVAASVPSAGGCAGWRTIETRKIVVATWCRISCCISW